jgi:release factor glutamine methyltransferase
LENLFPLFPLFSFSSLSSLFSIFSFSSLFFLFLEGLFFMISLGDVLRKGAQFVAERCCAPSSGARRRVEEVLAHVLGVRRLDLYLQFDRPLIEAELEQIRPLLRRVAQGEPVEYITGSVWFGGVQLQVNPHVLIPRPETELLLELAIKQRRPEAAIAWDLCTGSGCLGIALKKRCPDLAVTLSDLSGKALSVAGENARANGVEVTCLQGDLLAPFAGQKADLILCNPPYVSEAEYPHLDPSVRSFEPRLALVGGKEGLLYYERLSVELPAYLHPGAQIFFEIGEGQGAAVLQKFAGGPWRSLRVEKDWAGKERFFLLEFEPVIQ